jgi:galactose mutarotase-like enzyme
VVDGFDAVTLRSPAGLEATFVPAAGMVCCSLSHRGDELLGQRAGLKRYVETHGTMGIPLLHPWANRLAEERFALQGREIDLDRAEKLVHRDPNGLPIHGLLAGHPGWQILGRAADDDRSTLRANFDFSCDERLIGAFPFPHRLELDVRLRGDTLLLVTSLCPTADLAVPVSFGYHPYFRLPSVPRQAWEVELPVSQHLAVDSRMIPTGKREPATGVEDGPLGARTFDDGYVGVEPRACFAVAGGGRRIEVAFDDGYPVAVVYAPQDDAVICFEPMTAPTNALVSGDGLRWVGPGEKFTAGFSVRIFDSPKT